MKKANRLYLTAIAIMVITWGISNFILQSKLLTVSEDDFQHKKKSFFPYTRQVDENTFWFAIPNYASLSFKNGHKQDCQVILDPTLPPGIQVELDSAAATNPKALQHVMKFNNDPIYTKPHYYIYMDSLPPGKWIFRVGRMQVLDIFLESGVLSTAGEYTTNELVIDLISEFAQIKKMSIQAKDFTFRNSPNILYPEEKTPKNTTYFTGKVNKLTLDVYENNKRVLDFTSMYTRDILIEQASHTKIRITPQRCLRWLKSSKYPSNIFRTQKAKYEYLATFQ